MSKRPQDQRQKLNINNSSVQGQIGQAIRDLWQFQFLFLGKNHSEQEEIKNRKALIDKVRNFWIQGVLEKSLYNEALIALDLEKRLDAIEQPFNLDWVTPERLRQRLPSGTRTIDLFSQMGKCTTLLILGEPGGGKTITLLELARELIARAEEDASYPTPVIFNLSSWKGLKQPLSEWLVQELNEKYYVSKKLGKTYIREQKLLLLLDGLDEVHQELRNDCVLAINQLNQEYGRTSKVVCSRIRDYESLSQRFRFQGAIFIQPLSSEQVNQYLANAGHELTAIRESFQNSEILQDLLKSPLMLSVASLAYQGSQIQDLPKVSSTEEYIKNLFYSYIERMFFRRRLKGKNIYSKEKAKYLLSSLAIMMQKESQSVFLIERMQIAWLKFKFQRGLYKLLLAIVVGAYLSIIIGFPMGAAMLWSQADSGRVLGLSYMVSSVVSSTAMILPYTESFSLVGMLLIGTNAASRIELVSNLKWSIKRDKKKIFFLISGIIVIILYRIFGGWLDPLFKQYTWLLFSPISPLVGFLASVTSLIYTLLAGRIEPDIETSLKPNQGLWMSIVNSIVFTFISAMSVGLFFGIVLGLGLIAGIFSGLFIGLMLGFFGGGGSVVEHTVLRFILFLSGSTAWNYARFLDYAAERIFLQKVGGGYIFVHRLLLEHFSEMK